MLCFVLVTALMAKSHLVVRAEPAWVLKIWLWPSVAEKVSPSKVLHYCKQSLQSVSHFQSFHNIGVFQHSHGVNVSKEFLDPGEALFCFVNGLAGYHSRGGSGITSLRPQSLALVSSV